MDAVLSPTTAGGIMLAGGIIPGFIVYWLRTEPQGIVVRWFRFAMLCGMVWSVTFGLIALVDAAALRLALTNVFIIAVPSASIATFAFAYEFTFREPISRWYLVLFIPVVLLFVLSWFNPGELIYTVDAPYQTSEILVPAEPGSIRLPLNMIGSPLLVVMAAGLAAGELIRATTTIRRLQAGTVMLLITAAMVPGLMKVFELVPPYFDPTPIGWSLMGLVVAVTIKRFDLFRLSPNSLRRVVDALTDPVVVVNSEGIVSDANEAASEVFRLDLGMAVSAFSEANPALRPVFDGTETQVELTTGATERVFDYRELPVPQGYGTTGRILYFSDITEQADTAEALQAKTDRLDAFASRVSHDLQGPITVATSYVQIARRADDPADALDEIETALQRAETRIQDILAMARSGQQPARESVALDTAAHKAWAMVTTGDASLVVATDATLSADSQQLSRLFENLFRNAVEHGGEGVTVRVGTTDGGFYVADDGVGIQADKQATIFDERVSHDADGTGYGLAIVRDIVTAHGWTITATESTDGGARFEISGVGVDTAASTAADDHGQPAE
ncbi:histidine kinase N-terminal 7TM domain-containing protein [Halonotius sp. GCM10025705]|uniref:sensor histidine kinase n=1 Tax=Halonotius sp. GCM10025705 TaxID=3252678 RepID=UPI003616BD1F